MLPSSGWPHFLHADRYPHRSKMLYHRWLANARRAHFKNTLVPDTGLTALPISKIVARGFHAYWRRSRGMMLGAEGVVSDSAGRILLLRDAAQAWRLPGATVAAGQTAEAALRGVLEVQGIALDHADPALFWMFTDAAPWDMVATFRVTLTHAAPDGASAHASQGFFMPDALPAGIEAATMFRIKHVIEGQPPFDL